VTLHLSEHHGDGSPGSRVFIDEVEQLAAYHQQLLARPYKYNRPGLERPLYDPTALEMTVTDPFSNRRTFVERQ
jgi:hypothetical protein